MPTGAIVTVLSNIPWSQVIDNAPKVAEGAAKLWAAIGSLRKKPDAPKAEAVASVEGAVQPLSETDLLKAQVAALEETTRNLEAQMRASSELIKALADQNTQLVQRVEMNRVLLVRVSIVGAGLVLVLAGLVVYLLVR